jgi:hypothetical protein
VDLEGGHDSDPDTEDLEPEHLLFGDDDDGGTAGAGGLRRGHGHHDQAAHASTSTSTAGGGLGVDSLYEQTVGGGGGGVRVVSAAAGAQHTVLCDSRGSAWVFGSGYGVGHVNAGAWVGPSRVRGLPPVVVGHISLTACPWCTSTH